MNKWKSTQYCVDCNIIIIYSYNEHSEEIKSQSLVGIIKTINTIE